MYTITHSYLGFLKANLLLNLWFPSQSQLTCGRARQEDTVMIILALKVERMASSPGLVTAAAAAKSFQSCPTLCDPRDGSLSASSVPGILQARTLEWVAVSFSNA